MAPLYPYEIYLKTTNGEMRFFDIDVLVLVTLENFKIPEIVLEQTADTLTAHFRTVERSIITAEEFAAALTIVLGKLGYKLVIPKSRKKPHHRWRLPK
jgi:hypothetical protein